jgi:hypothetical protein
VNNGDAHNIFSIHNVNLARKMFRPEITSLDSDYARQQLTLRQWTKEVKIQTSTCVNGEKFNCKSISRFSFPKPNFQRYDANTYLRSLIRDLVFSPDCMYSMLKPLVQSSLACAANDSSTAGGETRLKSMTSSYRHVSKHCCTTSDRTTTCMS